MDTPLSWGSGRETPGRQRNQFSEVSKGEDQGGRHLRLKDKQDRTSLIQGEHLV